MYKSEDQRHGFYSQMVDYASLQNFREQQHQNYLLTHVYDALVPHGKLDIP